MFAVREARKQLYNRLVCQIWLCGDGSNLSPSMEMSNIFIIFSKSMFAFQTLIWLGISPKTPGKYLHPSINYPMSTYWFLYFWHINHFPLPSAYFCLPPASPAPLPFSSPDYSYFFCCCFFLFLLLLPLLLLCWGHSKVSRSDQISCHYQPEAKKILFSENFSPVSVEVSVVCTQIVCVVTLAVCGHCAQCTHWVRGHSTLRKNYQAHAKRGLFTN